MKNILLAILLLFSATAQGQLYPNTGAASTKTVTNEKGGRVIDSILAIPVRDTVDWQWYGFRKCGRLTFRPQDSVIYYNNCVKWLAVGSLTSGPGNFPGWDTLSYYYDELTLINYVTQKIQSTAVLLNDSVGGVGTNPWEWISLYYANGHFMPIDRTITINGVTKDINDNPVFTITGSGTCECEVTLDYLDSLFNTISTNTYYAGYAIIFNGDTISVDTSLIPTYHSLDTLRESIIDWVLEQGYRDHIDEGWATYVSFNDDTVGVDSTVLDNRYVNSAAIVGNNMIVDGVSYPIPCVCEGGGAVEWNDVQNKPTTFPPSAHTHTYSDIPGLQGNLDDKLNTSDTLDMLLPYLRKADSNLNGGFASYYYLINNFQPLGNYLIDLSGLTTDDLTEGSTNLYWTLTRFNTAFAAKTTDDLAQGSSNKYYSTTLFNTDFATKSTTDLAEGVNLYWTQGRFNTAFGAVTTDDLAEGLSNLYYSSVLFDGDFSGKTTTDLAEGTNLYWTNTRFDTRFGTKTTDDLAQGTSNKYYSSTLFDTDFATKTTDDLAEGTKKYFTNALARAAVSAGGDLSYNSSTGLFSYTTPAPADGSETIVTAGTDIGVTGTGTPGSPYVIAYTGTGGGSTAWTGLTGVPTNISELAALSFSANDIPQYVGGVLTKRTPAQVKASMSLTSTDVGLGNVPNIDATNANNLASGIIPAGRIGASSVDVGDINATGTPGATTVLHGNGTWATPSATVPDGDKGEVSVTSGVWTIDSNAINVNRFKTNGLADGTTSDSMLVINGNVIKKAAQPSGGGGGSSTFIVEDLDAYPVNGGGSNATTIFTTSAGTANFIVTGLRYKVNTKSGSGSSASLSVGTNATSYNNVSSSLSVNSGDAIGEVRLASLNSPYISIPPSTAVFVRINTNATHPTFTINILVEGYYEP